MAAPRWARARKPVLDAVGVRHVGGRSADVLLIVKISVLVAVIVLLG